MSEKLDKAEELAKRIRSLSALAHVLFHTHQCLDDNDDSLALAREYVRSEVERARVSTWNLAGQVTAMVRDLQSERDDLMIALDKEARGR